MKILAIETSCDETAVAVVEKRDGEDFVRVLAESKATSEETHKITKGVVPELAAREQLSSIIPIINISLKDAVLNSKHKILNSKQITNNNSQKLKKSGDLKISDWVRENIDAVAVTVGPGLIGSLLVGVETAKTLAIAWEKPMLPVNHLVGHLYANFVSTMTNFQFPISNQKSINKFQIPRFPAVGMVVSGGHTDLVLMKSHSEIQYLGGTRDDAAGECFDKCARVILDASYPGGPAISAAADKFEVRSSKFEVSLPRPMIHDKNYDFSFSGLKTAVVNAYKKQETRNKLQEYKNALAWELQEAVVEVLVTKLMRAVEEYSPASVVIGGGVAANARLKDELHAKCQMPNVKLFIPPLKWCSDNAVMIGAASLLNYSPAKILSVKADPGLTIKD